MTTTRIATALTAAALALAACGGSSRLPPSPAGPAASPGPTVQPAGPLFAVVEGAGSGTGGAAVAIVGMDGRAVARATLTPLRQPYVGNAMAIRQSLAQVGPSGVYYVDGYGVVRLLEPSGALSVVTTFAMTPDQHELWYAVSPDGRRLLAGVLSLPAVGPTPSGMPFPSLVGNWAFDLEAATAGGAATVLRHMESPRNPDSPDAGWKTVFPAGWTQAGPVAMVGAPLATQNAWPGGPLYVVGPDGAAGDQVGGAGCTAAHVLPSGVVPCVTGPGSAVEVRSAGGAVVWRPGVDGFDASALRLSPAADAITDGRHVATAAGLLTLPGGFTAQGWMGSQIVFGRMQGPQGPGDLAYVRLDQPATVHDLGFAGDFAGALPG